MPMLPRALLRVAADQPHEDRDERQRQQHQARGKGIDRPDPHEHGQRNRHCENDLRQVAGEVGLERLDTLHGRRGDLADLGPVEGQRLRAQPPVDQRQAELGKDRRRGLPPPDLERPSEHRAAGEREREQFELRQDLVQRGTREGRRDDRREQRRLEEDKYRGGDAERGVGGE